MVCIYGQDETTPKADIPCGEPDIVLVGGGDAVYLQAVIHRFRDRICHEHSVVLMGVCR